MPPAPPRPPGPARLMRRRRSVSLLFLPYSFLSLVNSVCLSFLHSSAVLVHAANAVTASFLAVVQAVFFWESSTASQISVILVSVMSSSLRRRRVSFYVFVGAWRLFHLRSNSPC